MENKDLFQDIEDRMQKGINVSMEEIARGTFLLLTTMKPQFLEQNSRIERLETEVLNLKKMVFGSEIQKSSNSVIIRKLPLHDKNKSKIEPKNLSIEVMKEVLKEIKLEDKAEIQDAFRFKPSENPPPNSIAAPMKVTFKTRQDCGLFFGALKHLKTSEKYKGIQISPDIPSCFKEHIKTLEKAAYHFRQQYKGAKTRISIKNGCDYGLFAKKTDEKNFSEIIWNENSPKKMDFTLEAQNEQV